MKSPVRLASTLLLAIGMLLAVCAQAMADVPPTSEAVHVYNSNGTPLADVDIYDRTSQQTLATTDGNGVAQISIQENCWDFGGDTVPDDQQCGSPNQYEGITATRSDDSGDPCNTGPEYFPGTPFPIGSWGSGDINVFLPTVPGTPYQPALSNEERGLLGVINTARADDGMAPLAVSATLTASADKYLGSVPARKLDYGQDAIYCENSGPGIRAADAGFPTSQDIGESVLQGAGNAAAAYADLQSDPHQDSLEDSEDTLIGIAQEGGTWVIDTSDLQTNSPYYARAADTGDVGDASLVSSEFPPPASDPGYSDTPPKTHTKSARDPRLKVTRAVVRRGSVTATLTLASGADGVLKVTAIEQEAKKHKVPLQVTRHGSKATIAGQLRPGRWIIRMRFVPRSGSEWSAAAVTRRITVLPRSR